MKIFSQIFEGSDRNGNPIPLFVMYLDSEMTGNPEKDIVTITTDYSSMINCEDPDDIYDFLISMIYTLVYESYGVPGSKEPITEYSATGFDPNCVNGVKGAELK